MVSDSVLKKFSFKNNIGFGIEKICHIAELYISIVPTVKVPHNESMIPWCTPSSHSSCAHSFDYMNYDQK